MTQPDLRQNAKRDRRPAARSHRDGESSSKLGLLLAWMGTSLLSLAFGEYAMHPLVLKRGAPTPAGASYRVLTPVDEARVAPYLLEELAAMEAELATHGFSTLRATDQPGDAITKFVLLVEQPAERTIGFFLLNASGHAGFTRVLTFQTNFADGIHMYTTNSTTVMRTRPRPQNDGARFPEITDVAALYAIHGSRVADRAMTVATAPLTRAPDPLAYEDRNAREVQSFWVERGYYRWTEEGRLAMTWRGAVLSAWRGLFPWKQLTRRAYARKRAEVEQRLGS